jgi:hypothetical protein
MDYWVLPGLPVKRGREQIRQPDESLQTSVPAGVH